MHALPSSLPPCTRTRVMCKTPCPRTHTLACTHGHSGQRGARKQRMKLPTGEDVQPRPQAHALSCTNADAVTFSGCPVYTHLSLSSEWVTLRPSGRDQTHAELDGREGEVLCPVTTAWVPSEAPKSPPCPSAGGLVQPSSSLIRPPSPGGPTRPAGGSIPTTSETVQELLLLASSLFHK